MFLISHICKYLVIVTVKCCCSFKDKTLYGRCLFLLAATRMTLNLVRLVALWQWHIFKISLYMHLMLCSRMFKHKFQSCCFSWHQHWSSYKSGINNPKPSEQSGIVSLCAGDELINLKVCVKSLNIFSFNNNPLPWLSELKMADELGTLHWNLRQGSFLRSTVELEAIAIANTVVYLGGPTLSLL